MYGAEPTLTFVSSDATATTYKKVCEAEATTPATLTSSSTQPRDDTGTARNHDTLTIAQLTIPLSPLRSNCGI